MSTIRRGRSVQERMRVIPTGFRTALVPFREPENDLRDDRDEGGNLSGPQLPSGSFFGGLGSGLRSSTPGGVGASCGWSACEPQPAIVPIPIPRTMTVKDPIAMRVPGSSVGWGISPPSERGVVERSICSTIVSRAPWCDGTGFGTCVAPLADGLPHAFCDSAYTNSPSRSS